MRKSVTAIAAILAAATISSAAMAFGPSNQNVPGSNGFDTSDLRGVTMINVQCYPRFDYSDRDPVTHTDIALTFQPGTDQLIQSFVVNHSLMSGRVINRDTQYAGTTWKKPGHFEWYWQGRQYDDPRISMLATLVRTVRGEWQYQEVVYRDGRVQPLPVMHCDRVDE